MKVGDLVRDDRPSWLGGERVGVIISESTDRYVSMALNRAFKILYRDGTIRNNVWDCNLKIIKSS